MFTTQDMAERSAKEREDRIADELAAIDAERPWCECGRGKVREVYNGKCEDCWVGEVQFVRMAKAKALRDVIPTTSVGVRVK